MMMLDSSKGHVLVGIERSPTSLSHVREEEVTTIGLRKHRYIFRYGARDEVMRRAGPKPKAMHGAS